MTIEIDVKAKEEDGTIIFEGKLNRAEAGFLLGYSINDLLGAGVQFYLDQAAQDEDGNDKVRIKYPEGQLN